MFPVIRLVFAAIGALLGANIGSGGGWFFAALVGAFIGFAIAELTLVRRRIVTLETEVAKLRASLGRRAAETPAPPRPAQSASPPSPPIEPVASPIEPVASPVSAAVLAPPDAHRRPAAQFSESDLPIVNAIRRFFTGGNALVRAGVLPDDKRVVT